MKKKAARLISKLRILKFFFAMIPLLLYMIIFQNCTSSSPSGVGNPGNASTSVVQKGARQLGVDILDTTPTSSFNNNISLVQAAGASYMILPIGWNQIESSTPSDCTTAGTYTDPGSELETFNSLLPANNIKLSLSILPISTSINLMPSNLAALPFDNSLVICRFQKMLSFVFSKIPNIQLVSMQFGNEIDEYSAASSTSFWSQYWGFYVNVSQTAKGLSPGLKTSVIGSLYGASGQSTNSLAQGGLKQIWNSADVVVVTYYPLNTDFTVKSPTVASSDISALANLYPNNKIYFNEIGFPSGSTSENSSQALQQQFLHDIFQVWDTYSTQIPNMTFVRLNDYSLSAAQSVAANYQLSGNLIFIEYLQTLGLRTYDGVDKPAFSQLKAETSARGW